MNGVRRRNESAWLLPNDGSRTNHQLRRDMRRYEHDEEVDIVDRRVRRRGRRPDPATGPAGVAGGGLRRRTVLGPRPGLGQRRGRIAPAVLERAPGHLGERSRRAREQQLGPGRRRLHGALRRATRPASIPLISARSPTTAWGPTGPSTTGISSRTTSTWRRSCPWPARTGPGGTRTAIPHSPHPMGGNGLAFSAGCAAPGIEVRVGPVAIANGRFGNRPHCIYRGFCLQGCKVNAKASPLITHVPDALAHGAEIRPDCMVSRVEIDDDGRATGVVYFHEGREYRQRARLVAVAGYSIETPRLLLNSACPQFPDGLCNDFDQVGRYVMVQGAPQTAGRYDEEIRSYKAPPPEASSEAFYETDPDEGLQARLLAPVHLAAADRLRRARVRAGPLGRDAPRVHARLRALGHLRGSVRVPPAPREPGHPGRRDRSATACPWPTSPTRMCDNDKALVEAATEVMEEMHHAAGAAEAITIKRVRPSRSGAAAWPRDERDGRGRRQPPDLRRAEPLHRRRQRVSHPGKRQSRAHHHGPRRPGRGLPRPTRLGAVTHGGRRHRTGH